MLEQITADQFLHSVITKNIGDFCANYFRLYIKDYFGTDKGFDNFICFLKWNRISDETIEIPSLFEKEEYGRALKEIQPGIKKLIANMVAEHVEEREFYLKLWEQVSDDLQYAQEIDKICVLVALSVDPRIPYFKLGQALKMDNGQYQTVANTIEQQISKAFFALRCGYEQNTEVASQLYSILQEIEDEEKRIVFLATIVGFFNAKYKMLYKKLQEDSKKISPEDE